MWEAQPRIPRPRQTDHRQDPGLLELKAPARSSSCQSHAATSGKSASETIGCVTISTVPFGPTTSHRGRRRGQRCISLIRLRNRCIFSLLMSCHGSAGCATRSRHSVFHGGRAPQLSAAPNRSCWVVKLGGNTALETGQTNHTRPRFGQAEGFAWETRGKIRETGC